MTDPDDLPPKPDPPRRGYDLVTSRPDSKPETNGVEIRPASAVVRKARKKKAKGGGE